MPPSTLSLARRIYDVAHLPGQFQLRSGLVSAEYFDKYLFEAEPALLAEVTSELVNLIPTDVDALAGLELGGVPLATLMSQRTGLPTLFVRKKAKEYGTCRLAEGGDVRGRRLAIVEDVVTTGGQIITSAAALRAAGAHIDVVVCVIDREAGGAANLGGVRLALRSVFTMSSLRAAAAS
jgi:orotate phosphoribosyltransferase